MTKWTKKVVFLFIFSFYVSGLLGQVNTRLTELLDSVNLVEKDAQKIELFIKVSKEYQKNDLSKALEYAQMAYKLALQNKSSLLFYKAIFSVGEAYYVLHRYDSSRYYFDRIIKRSNKISNYNLLGNVYSMYGYIYSSTADYDSSFLMYSKALEYHVQINDKKGKAETYNRLSLLYKAKGLYDSSLYYLLKARNAFESAGDSTGIVKTLGNAGKTLYKIGDYEKAKEYFLQALKILEVEKNLKMKGKVYHDLGTTYYHLEDMDSCIYYFEMARENFRTTNNISSLGHVTMNIGAVYEKENLYDKALAQYNQAIQIFREINDVNGIVVTKKNIAVIHERKQDYSRALEIYDTVLTMCIGNQYGELLEGVYFNIFKTYELMGDFQNAFHYQSEYTKVKDSLLNLKKLEKISELEIKYQKEKTESELLALQNSNLIKDLQIKKQKNQRNIAVITGLGTLLIILILYIGNRQRAKKDRVIREKEIERLKEEKRVLAAKALIEGQEKERKRLAGELHDGLGVLLSNVKMQFNSFLDKNPENTQILNKANKVLEVASNDLRRISHNMMPGVLVKLGLIEALNDFLDEINEGGKINAEIEVIGEETGLDENREIIIYRIFQEMINNTLKHANASNISVIIRFTNEQIHIQYADDGTGFDKDILKEKRSLGLKSIESRIDFLGGEWSLETSPGKGVEYNIYIHLK